MIKVLVADDHAVVRRGVLQILDEDPEVTLVAEAATGQAVLKAARERPCDIVILDIALPDLSGLEVLAQLQEQHPHLRVIILSMYPETQYARRSLRAGAAAYLTKDSAPDELLAAIHKVAGGGVYVTMALAETLAADLASGEQQAPHERLSDREYQVLTMLAAGQTLSDIAGELSLSASTVSTYRARILEKLSLNNTAEIIRYAVDRGLVD